MSGLMADIADQDIAPATGNAIVSAGRALLDVKKMELKYGRPDGKGGVQLQLAPPPAPNGVDVASLSARLAALEAKK